MVSRTGMTADVAGSTPTRPETYQIGKIFTYLLNAQTDVCIAEALLNYVKNGRFLGDVTEVELRASAFIDSFQKSARRIELVSLAAYTMDRINGLADYLFAHLLMRGVSRRQQAQVEALIEKFELRQALLSAYGGEIISWPSIISIGTRLLSGDRQDIDAYARGHGLVLEALPPELLPVIVHVQTYNVSANARTARALNSDAESGYRKIWAIKLAARQTPHPNEFIRASANTQMAASRWDQAFAWVIALKARMTADSQWQHKRAWIGLETDRGS